MSVLSLTSSDVPNDDSQSDEIFQDNDPSVPANILPFERLPFEMIEQILKNLDKNQRQRLRLVNKLWNHSISNTFLLRMELTVHNLRTIIKSDAEIIALIIPGMSQKMDLGGQVKDFEIFCLRIRKVEFSGPTHAENIHLLLHYCKSIKTLKVNRALPVRKAIYENTSTYNIAGYATLPRNRNVPNGFIRNLTTFSFVISQNKWMEEIDLVEVVSHILDQNRLKKLSVETEGAHLEQSLDDRGDVFRTIHGFASTINTESHYQKILRGIISNHTNTLEHLKIRKFQRPNQEEAEVLDLKFYPRALTEKFRVEKFKAKKPFYEVNRNRMVVGPWLKYLLDQDRIKTLDLDFNDSEVKLFHPNDGLPIGISRTETAYVMLNTIMIKNNSTLVTIVLNYQLNFRVPPSFNLAIISRCSSLRSLTVINTFDNRVNNYSAASPNFTGMSMFPSSLEYFATNFSIRSEVANIDKLDLSNLTKLKTLVYSAQPPFIFNIQDAQPQMNMGDFKVLVTKIPTLKKVLWGIGYNTLVTCERNSWKTRFQPFSPPTICMELANSALRNLEYVRQYGPFHELHL